MYNQQKKQHSSKFPEVLEICLLFTWHWGPRQNIEPQPQVKFIASQSHHKLSSYQISSTATGIVSRTDTLHSQTARVSSQKWWQFGDHPFLSFLGFGLFSAKNRCFQRGYYKNIYENIYDHNWSSTGDDNYTLQVDNNLWILMLTSLGMCQRKDVDQPCFWMHFQVFQKICWTPKVENTLQETNISHHGKKKIIFKGVLGWDMLVPSRVTLTIESHIFIDRLCFPCHIHVPISLNLTDPEGKFGWASSNPSHVSSLQTTVGDTVHIHPIDWSNRENPKK